MSKKKTFNLGRGPAFLVALVSAVLTWWVYYGVSVWAGSLDPTFVAWGLLVSVLVHECGHWLAMELAGVRASIIFLVILGGTFPIDDKSRNRLAKGVNWSTDILISLAGPLGNAAVIIGANLLAMYGDLPARYAVALTSLNAGLICVNLLPIAGLDGRKFVKSLFNSAPEKLDRVYARYMGGAVIAGCIILMLSVQQLYIFYPLLLTLRLSAEADLDDPRGSRSRRAMTRTQECVWMGVYVTLFLVAAGITLTTPYWTKVL